MAQHVGWNLHLERCPQFDTGDKMVFALNLVMPYCRDENGDVTMTSGDALSYQQFLFPHEWETPQFALYWDEGTGLQQMSRLQEWLLPQAANAAELIKKAILEHSRDARDTFSIEDEHFSPKARDSSLAHLLSHLTHWPTGLSETVLARSFHFSIEKASVPVGKPLAVFPSFLLAGGVRFKPQNFTLRDDLLEACDGDYSFTCKLLADSSAYVAAPVRDVKLNQSQLSLLDLRALVVQFFHPISLARTSLVPLINDRPADIGALRLLLQKTLVQLIGTGWDKLYVGADNALQFPHLFELLPDWKSLLKASGSPAIPQKIRLGNDEGDRYIDTATAYKLLTDTLPPSQAKDLTCVFVPPDDDGIELIAAWTRLAQHVSSGNTGIDFTLNWLQHIDGAFFANQPVQTRWNTLIHAKISEFIRSGINARVWHERCTQGALDRLGNDTVEQRRAFWEAIYALADEAAKGAEHDQYTLKQLIDELAADLYRKLKQELRHEVDNRSVFAQVKAFADAIIASCKNTTSIIHEPGLKLVFDTASKDLIEDQQLRGYAIALRTGVSGAGLDTQRWDNRGARWITDTAFNLADDTANLLTTQDGVVWLHETIGSTISNGRPVVSAEYAGSPLASIPYRAGAVAGMIEPAIGKDQDFDGFTEFEFLWPNWLATGQRPLPLLGYGLCYQAAATPIGNAGAILGAHRETSSITRLSDASTVFTDDNGAVYFRSRKSVAAPDVRLVDARPSVAATPSRPVLEESLAYALSSETRAAAWLGSHGRHGKAPLVALLTNGSEIWSPTFRSRAYELLIRPPRPDAAFVERWLNRDVMEARLKTYDFSNPAFDKNDSEVEKHIVAFRDAMVERLRAAPRRELGGQPNEEFHPAVVAFGVRIVFNGDDLHPQQYLHELVSIQAGTLPYQSDLVNSTLRIKVSAAAASEKSRYISGSKELRLLPGHFAQLTLYSLIDRAWIDDPVHPFDGARFHALDDFSEFSDGEPRSRSYVRCDGAEYVFETAPDAALPTPTDDWLRIEQPQPQSPGKLSLRIDSPSKIAADWLLGAHYHPYDFHWTGYPLSFPALSSTGLADWLLAHAKGNTERPDLQGDVVFQTTFDDTSPVPGWQIGARPVGEAVFSAGICERRLRATSRPATHIAYAVRLRIRFRDWLQPLERIATAAMRDESPWQLEQRPLAVGAFIPGIAPDLVTRRLPVPPLRTAIPLTATRWPVGAATASTPQLPELRLNGNMLIFDEEIRRTDFSAAVGGIGDTLEIDVLSSRVFSAAGATRELNRMGVNPIFHKPPPVGPAVDAPPSSLLALEPFGLSNDQADNASVAQTGVILVPQDGTGGWTMAEVRTRRLILPEVLMGTAVLPGADGYALPLRQEGEEYVPLDFCLDMEAALDTAAVLTLRQSGHPTVTIPINKEAFVPNLNNNTTYRLLASWHKDRWDRAAPDGNPTWRLQIMAQQRGERQLEWKLAGKISCTRSGFDWTQKNAGGGLLVQPSVSVEAAYVVLMSDYTPGIWLQFMGNFTAKPAEPGTYILQRGTTNSLALKSRPGSTFEPPRCVTLPATFEASAGQEFEFHWLLVYRPLSDVTRSGINTDAGALVGAWRYDGEDVFSPLDPGNTGIGIDGCYAYLCTFHRASALSAEEIVSVNSIASTPMLMNLMFPAQENRPEEALIRMVPKLLGPLPIL